MRLAVLPLLLASSGAFAATFTVSNTNDSGAGSLRAAILSANASSGADAIQIEVTGVILLTSGQYLVSGDLTINGPGADQLALDAQRLGRVFNVQSSQLSLSGLTVRNGRAPTIQSGGAFLVNGELNLIRCRVENNEVLLNAGITADGGAAFVASGRRLTADQCAFIGNRVGLGSGGAIRGASSSVLEFRNCTFSGNSATQGGALSSAGQAKFDFCTVAENSASGFGGGVWSAGSPVVASSSIFALNSAPSGPNWFGAVSSSGFNLLSNPANSSGWALTDLLNVDPLLGPFDPAGYYPLLEGSLALDSANPLAFLALDQRDMPRPQAAGPDRGAFEAETFNEAPSANAGPDQIVECTGSLTQVHLDGSGSSDPDGDALQFQWFENGAFIAEGDSPSLGLPKGHHLLTLVVTDPSGESDSDEVLVQVSDTTAPEISGASASPGSLWPPNHKMWSVNVAFSVSDAADPNPSNWLSVTSSDPDSGMSPEDVPGDIEVIDGHTVRLRAERFERARIYTITIHAQDADGNESSKSVTVVVPKSMGRA